VVALRKAARRFISQFVFVESRFSGLLTIDEGMEAFVVVVEDHGDGYLTVFVPGPPNPASGNVQVVRKDLVRMLNVRMTDVGSVQHQCGVGSAKVLAKHKTATPADLPSSGVKSTYK
jgi:uncharacterized membrane protein